MEGKLINLFLAKIELYLLKIIPMLIAACCLTNTTFSYFGIELEILSYISGMSILPIIYFYVASYRCKLKVYDVKDYGEPPAYTIGFLVMKMYRMFKYLKLEK